MIRNKDDLLRAINERFTDDNSDEVLSLIEDVTDTFNDLEIRAADSINWEEKYNSLDADWRRRYRERFFDSDYQPEDPKEFEDDEEPELKTKFEELFEEG